MKKIIYSVLALIAFASVTNGQMANSIYMINSPGSGIDSGKHYFAKIDLTTRVISNLRLLPASFFSSYTGSCIDNQSKRYYVCNGPSLMTIDANTDSMISIVGLGVPDFEQMTFNPCDSLLYGFWNNGTGGNFTFTKINPVTLVKTDIPGISLPYIAVDGFRIIDPSINTYIFEKAFGEIGKIRLSDGNYSTATYTDLSNETFGHMAMRYSTHEIFGTSANAGILGGYKYLAKVDLTTGTVSHVSPSPWTFGIWKSGWAGSCINQLSDNYYYVGAFPLQLIGINTTSGQVISQDTLNAGVGDIYGLQYFSQPNCNTTRIDDVLIGNDFTVYPNPSLGNWQLTVGNNFIGGEAEVFDTNGKVVFKSATRNPKSEITFEAAKGVYLLRISSSKGSATRKLVRL